MLNKPSAFPVSPHEVQHTARTLSLYWTGAFSFKRAMSSRKSSKLNLECIAMFVTVRTRDPGSIV